MGSVNKAFVLGNLTRDVELRTTKSGMQVADLGIAVNERTKNGETTTFVDVTCWDKTAEIAAKYLSKGSPVHIEGRLRRDDWQDEGGRKYTKTYIVCDRLTFVGSRDDQASSRAAKPQQPATSRNPPPDDEIPF